MVRVWLLCLSLVILALPLGAEEATAEKKLTKEEILQNPYFVALLQLRLEEKQQKKFQRLINSYAQKRGKAIDKEKRRYKGDLRKAIARAHDKIRAKFDKDMRRLLTDDQYERFPVFLAELDKMLAGRESLDENINASEMFEHR